MLFPPAISRADRVPNDSSPVAEMKAKSRFSVCFNTTSFLRAGVFVAAQMLRYPVGFQLVMQANGFTAVPVRIADKSAITEDSAHVIFVGEMYGNMSVTRS